MKKINTLLFNQGGKCFYCNAILDIKEASIDHVIPRAKGGTDNTDNLVVCCKYANHAFADCSPKHKMAVIKQLCCFPSACQKIFPREEETIKPNENSPEKLDKNIQSTNAQVAKLKKNVESLNAQVTKLEKQKQSSNAQVAQFEKNMLSTKKPKLAINDKNAQPDISFAYQLLCQAIKSLESNGGVANNSSLKSKMLALNSSFNESDYGFKQFNQFLLQAEDDQIVTLKTGQKKGNYIVSCAKQE
jgi:septal ring factor EnvC (AmiA/AmiB activator)